MLRHFVHLRFPSTIEAASKQDIYLELSGLRNRIDGIIDFQYRANISVETSLIRGFYDMFWFDFRDSEIRDIYLKDERHQAIGKKLIAAVDGGKEGIFVCDIEL